MAAVSNMLPVSFPRFASASTTAAAAMKHHEAGAVPPTGWGETGTGDTLDFDMLAEYLLEDGTAGGLPTFDFSTETPPVTAQEQQPQSGVVSPEQTPTPFADPLADAAAQMKQAGVTIPAPSPAAAGPAVSKATQAQQIVTTPVATLQQQRTPAPAPAAAIPPPPLAAPIPAPAPPVPTPIPATPAIPVPMPASLVPALGAGPRLNGLPLQPPMLQNPLPDSNKRRRIDAAAPLVAAATASPVGAIMTMNGQIMPPHQVFPPRGGRQKTQAQIDRRRERNRILARRTRLRKKFFFESLQKDVTDLHRENCALKEIVRTRLNPGIAKPLLDDCKANEELPGIVAEQCGVPSANLARQDFNLIQGIQKSQQCFVITDPSLQDNPIVYASDDFLTLTGYSREEVLGRNCRFLQGTETSPAKVAQIRKGVTSGEDCTVTLVNYTADGTAFWNNLFIAALRDAQNNIVNFIGVIVKVAGPDPSDPEAGKRLPGEVDPADGLGDGVLGDDPVGSGLADDDIDAAAVAEAAEGTLNAIEGAVTAALVTTPAMNGNSTPAS